MAETVAVTHINVIIQNLVLLPDHAHGPRNFSPTLDSAPSGTSLIRDLMTVSGFS